MAVPFGFSIGDFIAVGCLVYDIIETVSSSKGATADYKSFVFTLRSLGNCINAIKNVLEKYLEDNSRRSLQEESLINGIVHETNRCRDLLCDFLDSTYEYSASLLPNNEAKRFKKAKGVISHFRARTTDMKQLKKAWREVLWAVFRKEDVQKFERDLQGHLRPLQMYGTYLQILSQSRVEKATAEAALVTRETYDMVAQMFHFLISDRNVLPPQISDKMDKCQPIFFQDALGRSIELPRELCVSIERLQRHLEILFEDLPGHKKVAKKEYELEDATGATLISADNWHLKVTAGATIVMSMLFQLASIAQRPAAQTCPRCNTVNTSIASSSLKYSTRSTSAVMIRLLRP
ncbi:hypothetical protein EDB81DRAFT_791710 [Dactylonectria macrodidyma]|uniref:Ubiquitin-like domain-containing protein n=1 Tax=Dactylonectria macrodidyma TaxID=307937 RepID=A0A9P9JBQ7_9HYPO|nr:hypothetical protein EDB81DRAFT_791710 [Dactylonectria macrodidyma]